MPEKAAHSFRHYLQSWLNTWWLSLYADDILLFLQNTRSAFSEAISEAITLIDNSFSISDYSMVWAKSTILPLNCRFEQTYAPVRAGNILYFGINFSPKLFDVPQLNFTPLLEEEDGKLANFKEKLPLDLLGKVATVKIMVSP